MKLFALVAGLMLLCPAHTTGQEPPECRLLCAPEFSVEPTVTVGNVFGSPRLVQGDGVTSRARRSADFEVIFSLGLPTALPWLEFGVEAIVVPFDDAGTPELEFEASFVWLPSERTNGWISSHFDVVDKFSPAQRPTDRRAYTHKLNIELDSGVSLFNWMREGRWLRGVQLEGSLDYVASGLPQRGDVVDGTRYVDRASPWSFSLVLVLPVAPM